MAEALQAQLQAAEEAAALQPAQALAQLRDVLLGPHLNDAESIKVKESALTAACKLMIKQRDSVGLRNLLTDLRPLFGALPKAKTAKIVRTVIDSIAQIPDSTELQVTRGSSRGRAGGEGGAPACLPQSTPPPHAAPTPAPAPALQLEVCKEQVAWATTEKRTFLRQRIEVRLAGLLLGSGEYQAALALIAKLLVEVKRLDDKLLLVDIHLLESKVRGWRPGARAGGTPPLPLLPQSCWRLPPGVGRPVARSRGPEAPP